MRVVDGGKLKHWLGLAPGVTAHWAAGWFGAYPPDVASTAELWEEYTSGCALTITEQLLLAGRSKQAESVIQRLSTLQPDRIEIAADSAEEALAFALASLRLACAHAGRLLQRGEVMLEPLQRIGIAHDTNWQAALAAFHAARHRAACWRP